LFDLRANLRFGCVILRHYLDQERGDLFRALGRYNGSVGQSAYPDAVIAAARRWGWSEVSPEVSPARPTTVRTTGPTTGPAALGL
jgi:soluble lytic murein transglycosylase-like protein